MGFPLHPNLGFLAQCPLSANAHIRLPGNGGGYAGKLVLWAKDKTNLVLEIIRRMPWAEGFVVIKRRWVVERTFAWIMQRRRLVRDYEQLPAVAETLIVIAASATLLRRWP